MKKIILQAGHEGVTSGQTGAPGEQELTVRIRNRLSTILQSKGFQLFLVDANPPDSQINQDFDLFLALHGDSDYPNDNGSGFTDYPEPSTDQATIESQRLAKVIASEYFKNSGINEVSHSNPNTRYYYMWNRLSAATPCVILEMGQVADPHDKVILADTDRVCNAIARGICKAFNVNFDTTTPTPQIDYPQIVTELKKTIELKQNKIEMLEETITNYKLAFTHIKEDIPNF
jgi:N-acetylmuramoyl-L-alanine amidase